VGWRLAWGAESQIAELALQPAAKGLRKRSTKLLPEFVASQVTTEFSLIGA